MSDHPISSAMIRIMLGGEELNEVDVLATTTVKHKKAGKRIS